MHEWLLAGLGRTPGTNLLHNVHLQIHLLQLDEGELQEGGQVQADGVDVVRHVGQRVPQVALRALKGARCTGGHAHRHMRAHRHRGDTNVSGRGEDSGGNRERRDVHLSDSLS